MTRAAYARPFGGGDGGGGGGGATDPVWTRFLLNSGSVKADPGGGATVTVNGESASGWTDISRPASTARKVADQTTWSRALTKADGSALTWSDSFTIETHIIFNQATAAGDTFAGQMVLPIVANAAAPSTNAHFWWGEGMYSSNGTTVKLGRAFSADSAVNPAFTAQQVKSSGWTNQGRVHAVYTNNIQRGAFIGAAAFRNFDNTAFQPGTMSDQQGFLNGMTSFAAGATDQVYLILHVPGWNSSNSYDIVNCQFKLFYHVNYLPQNPAP